MLEPQADACPPFLSAALSLRNVPIVGVVPRHQLVSLLPQILHPSFRPLPSRLIGLFPVRFLLETGVATS